MDLVLWFGLPMAFAAFVAGGTQWAISSAWKGMPFQSEAASGRMRPVRWINALCGLLLGAVVLAGAAAAVTLFASQPGALLAGLGGSIALAILPYSCLHQLSPASHVNWTIRGAEGPSGPLSFRRSSIAWDDVKRIDTNWLDVPFIEGSNGQRIYWTVLHVGQQAFLQALFDQRPDLYSPWLNAQNRRAGLTRTTGQNGSNQ